MANIADLMFAASRNAVARARPDYDTRGEPLADPNAGIASIREQLARRPEPYRDPEEYIDPKTQDLINDPKRGPGLLERLMNEDDALSADDVVPEHGTDEYYDMLDRYIRDQRGPKERT